MNTRTTIKLLTFVLILLSTSFPALAHSGGGYGGGFRCRVHAPNSWLGPCRCDGSGWFVGRIPWRSCNLDLADRISANYGVWRGCRNNRIAHSGYRDGNCALRGRAGADDCFCRASTNLGLRRDCWCVFYFSWLRPWHRTSGNRKCICIRSRFRHIDRITPSHRDRIWPVSQVASGPHRRAGCGRIDCVCWLSVPHRRRLK